MLKFLTSLTHVAVWSLGAVLSGVAAAQDSAVPLALKGYDAVAYFTEKRPVKGMNERSFEFDGARYLFSSDKHRATFAANPDRYAPQFAANCTAGLAAGKKVQADPNHWAIVDGKLYVFASEAALVRAKKDPGIVATAAANWSKLK